MGDDKDVSILDGRALPLGGAEYDAGEVVAFPDLRHSGHANDAKLRVAGRVLCVRHAFTFKPATE